ncbi:TraM recognition domain-containing protein [Pseudomonas canadensis]|uniref:TraM recognition domain-containing protein n=1 Tax=Pseudomonas canadensis TaxID=915099 RepID=UPI0028117884|nr:TraM recognition domain-containing protein [Pseudomonas canadensis]
MEILRFILLNTDPGLTTVFCLMIGVLLVLAVTGAVKQSDDATAMDVAFLYARRCIMILLCAAGPLLVIGLYAYAYAIYGFDGERATSFMKLWYGEFRKSIADLWWCFLVVLSAPMFLRMIMLRWVRPKISGWLRKFRVQASGDALSDIRIDMDNLKAKDFNPLDYYLKGQMFLGLDDKGEAIYMADELFRKNHAKVIGPSQTGKGVMLGVLLDQAIMKGWGAWFVDQKPDDFIYDIMRESCERHGRPAPLVLDLNGVGPGSYGPFIGGTRRERRERVVKTFGMADNGTNADFFKREERKVLDYLMPLWDGTLGQLAKLLKGKHPEINEQMANWVREKNGSIESNVSEFMQLDTLRATVEESFDVAAALNSGAVVYVRSNINDTIVRKACIALLDEVVQIVLKKRLEHPTYLSLDEVRFIVSQNLADALATILSKNVFASIAYQALTDLLNLPDKTLNAESIKGGIDINTQITLTYRANDYETALWLANMTGIAQKTVTKMEKVEVNKGGAEVWGDERSVGQVEETTVTTNQLLALPARVSALIRPNHLAVIIYTCWITVKEAKGLPPRNPVQPPALPAKPPAATTPAPTTASTSTEEDPFDSNAANSDDPFASLNENPGDDPFAALASATDDPFSSIDSDEINGPSEDPFAGTTGDDEARFIPEPDAPKKPAGKAKLSADQLAAIEAAGLAITSPGSPKPKPAAKADLSSLDDIEGI